MNPYHLLGYSSFSYKYPIRPRKGEEIRFWENNLSHVGIDKHAKDIIVPDPREKPLTIWAPRSGIVASVVQHNTKWGRTKDFENYMNYIEVKVGNNEFYMIVHIKASSCVLSKGDKVTEGMELATTGLSGWMEDVRHLHFMVSRYTKVGTPTWYQSLKIRWDKDQSYAPAK